MNTERTTEATRSIVNAYIEAVLADDGTEGLTFFADDVDLEIPGDVFRVPWIGRRRGRSGVAAFLRGLRAAVASQRFEIQSILVEGERAVVLGELVSRVRSTGKLIETAFSMDLTVRDGRIVRFRFLEDSFAVSQAMTDDSIEKERLKQVDAYFRKVDARDPSLIDLFTDDFEFFFPKFGRGRGKSDFARLQAVLTEDLEKLEHDIDRFRIMVSGNFVIVEGTEKGVTRSGISWPDGVVSEGRFCDVFEFDGVLIRRVYVYVDPDFTSAHHERVRVFRPDPVINSPSKDELIQPARDGR